MVTIAVSATSITNIVAAVVVAAAVLGQGQSRDIIAASCP